MFIRTCRLALLLLFVSFSPWGLAAGPAAFAVIDRSTWPQLLDGPAEFDSASRAEILMFGKALLDSEALGEAQLRQQLGLKEVNMTSLERVRQRFWKRLLESYRMASKDCADRPFCIPVGGMGEFRQRLAFFSIDATSPYFRWSQSSQGFHQLYLNEQLRLAALFPRISSEIETFSDAERTGEELADRQFLLSFDDGPTAIDGNTDKVAALMRENKLHAMFFVLGRNYQARLARSSVPELKRLYDGQCVALHGWEHRSHAQWGNWRTSVSNSKAIIKDTLPQNYRPLFRPPYGQRHADAQGLLKAEGIDVSLWNIDSQDWSRPISAQLAEQRVQTLMLLWRRGVILFHDVHAKAASAVPALVEANRTNGVEWLDCHDYG